MRIPGRILLTIALVLAVTAPTFTPLAQGASATAGPGRAALPAMPAGAGLSATVDIRVNAGGLAYSDSLGQAWQADKAYAPGSWGYTGGSVFTTTQTIVGTADQTLYQSQRSNPVSYNFDVPNDVYQVTLRFAEIYCTTNCRAFNVKIEGQQLLTNFNPLASAGFRTALDTTFYVPVTDNQLRIEFVTGTGAFPFVNALRVTGSAGAPPRNAVRINSGGFDFKDSAGNLWTADQKYLSGAYGYTDPPAPAQPSTAFQTTSTISNVVTADQTLWRNNRYGMTGYTFDMPTGAYRVDLLTAEIYSSVNSAGARVFDIWAEGSKQFSNVDVFNQTGNRNRAMTETFNIVILDSQLNITFTAKTANPPIVNAIAVTPLDSVLPGPWTDFTPSGWQGTQQPSASVRVSDAMAGLNVSSAQYAYSTNAGASFSEWQAALTTGANGTTDPQTVAAYNIPFNQDSGTQNRVKFRIADMSSNIGSSGVYTVAIDSLPPTSLVTSPPPGSLIGGPSVQIQGTSAHAGSGVQQVEVSTNGGASWNPATGTTAWSYVWTLPGDGIYNLRARGRDLLGHVETPAAGITVTVDSTPPVTFISRPQSGQTITGTTYLITGTAYDATSGLRRVEVSVDGGSAWITATGASTWSYNWTPGNQGSATIRARAVDIAGNVDNPGTAVGVIIDRIAPAATIQDPSPGRNIRGSQYTISGSASDDATGSGLAAIEVSTDGATWQTATGLSTWYYTWSPLPTDGPYTIRSRARDLAGNVQSPAASVTVTVDNAVPVSTAAVNGTMGLAGWYVSPLSIDIVASDTTSGVKAVYYRIDSGPWITYTGSISLTSAGSHSFVYYAVDNAGNTEASHVLSLQIDTSAPMTVVGFSGPGNIVTWFRGPVAATAAALDSTSGVRSTSWSLDGSAWTPYTGAVTIGGEGVHTFSYYSTDNAGNTETTHQQSPRIDSLAPLVTISAPQAGRGISGTTFLVTGTANDSSGSGVSGVEFSLDGAAWTAVTGKETWSYQWVYSVQGSHNLRARATDQAGNVSDPGSGIYVTVDNTQPSSSINDPFDGAIVHGSSVVVSGSAADAYSGVDRVEVSTNGGATWTAATLTGDSDWVYTWMPSNDGRYTLRSRAVDRASNVEIPGPGISVQIDSIAPSSNIASPASGQFIHGASFEITGIASDIGSSVKRVEVSIDGGPWYLADGAGEWSYTWSPLGSSGAHVLRSRATDFAGNIEPLDAGITVIVDNSAPVSNITGPANRDVITTETLLITGSASDTLSTIKRTEVNIRRAVDGASWDGSQWSGAETWLTTDGAPDSWSYLWTSLPRVGSFTIRSRATDNIGNVEEPATGVTVLMGRGMNVFLPTIINDEQ